MGRESRAATTLPHGGRGVEMVGRGGGAARSEAERRKAGCLGCLWQEFDRSPVSIDKCAQTGPCGVVCKHSITKAERGIQSRRGNEESAHLDSAGAHDVGRPVHAFIWVGKRDGPDSGRTILCPATAMRSNRIKDSLRPPAASNRMPWSPDMRPFGAMRRSWK